jgi:hypothetical protein
MILRKADDDTVVTPSIFMAMSSESKMQGMKLSSALQS